MSFTTADVAWEITVSRSTAQFAADRRLRK
jgi:hypothetical protein